MLSSNEEIVCQLLVTIEQFINQCHSQHTSESQRISFSLFASQGLLHYSILMKMPRVFRILFSPPWSLDLFQLIPLCFKFPSYENLWSVVDLLAYFDRSELLKSAWLTIPSTCCDDSLIYHLLTLAVFGRSDSIVNFIASIPGFSASKVLNNFQGSCFPNESKNESILRIACERNLPSLIDIFVENRTRVYTSEYRDNSDWLRSLYLDTINRGYFKCVLSLHKYLQSREISPPALIKYNVPSSMFAYFVREFAGHREPTLRVYRPLLTSHTSLTKNSNRNSAKFIIRKKSYRSALEISGTCSKKKY